MATKLNLYIKVIFLYFLAEFTTAYPYECPAAERKPWSYQGLFNGPPFWGLRYPNCYGTEQSPININTKAVQLDPSLQKLEMINYDVTITSNGGVALNTGYTVVVTPQDLVQRSIEFNRTSFILRQLHFHWSNRPNGGTEHAFDRRRFDIEGHFVHTSADGETAVVGVLYKASSEKNNGFESIVDALFRIQYEGYQTGLLLNLNLNDLLPSKTASFYHYKGSLTTPDCEEGVLWFVVKEVSYIGKEQLSQFFRLHNVPTNEATPGCRMTSTVRPLQSLNSRVVTSSV